MPISLSLIAGVVIGIARRGRLAAVARTRVRHLELLVVALAASLIVDLFDVGGAGAIALVGLVGGLAFAIVNVHLVGMAVVGIGVSSNLLVVALNGGMPVRPEALVEAEMVTVDELDRVSLTGARVLADDDTVLGGLGDTFPVRWTGQVVSIGDLIMLVGVTDVVANLFLQRRRRRLPAGGDAALGAFGWPADPEDPPETIDLTDQPASANTTTSPVHD